MPDKPSTNAPKKPKPKPAEAGVMSSLSATRPPRLGGERRRAGASKAASNGTPKPRAKTAAKRTTKPATKPVAKRTTKPATKPVAKRAAKPAATVSAAGKPLTTVPPTAARKPKPVRAGARGLDPSPKPPGPSPTAHAPSGTELVTTAIQAAGELAQIGLTVGGQILKRAVDRLPRP